MLSYRVGSRDVASAAAGNVSEWLNGSPPAATWAHDIWQIRQYAKAAKSKEK